MQEFLLVVLAEVEEFVGSLVESKDVIGGLEFGNGDEADRGLRGLRGGVDAGENARDISGKLLRAGSVYAHLRVWRKLALGHDIRYQSN